MCKQSWKHRSWYAGLLLPHDIGLLYHIGGSCPHRPMPCVLRSPGTCPGTSCASSCLCVAYGAVWFLGASFAQKILCTSTTVHELRCNGFKSLGARVWRMSCVAPHARADLQGSWNSRFKQVLGQNVWNSKRAARIRRLLVLFRVCQSSGRGCWQIPIQ